MPVNAEQNQLNQQNKDQNQNGQGPINMAGSGGNASSGSSNSNRVASFSSGNAPQQANSSGRYTNLSKYINANQGAGDRLNQGISNKIQQGLQPQQKDVDTSANAVKEGISGANNSLNKGSGYLNQLGDQNFNAQNFASDQNQLQDFTKYRTGSAIDTNQLGNLNNTAQTNNATLQNSIGNRQTQVGTESGRFQLLNEAFGGGALNKNPYSTGQQRLDQLFFQSQGPSNITNLQNSLQNNLNQSQQIGKTLDQYGNDISGVGAQQTALAGNLQDKTNQMSTGYINDLQGQVAGINTGRDALRDKYGNFTNQLIGSAQGQALATPLDEGLFNEAGLHQGEQVFNTFNNLDPNTRQFVNYDDRNANDYHDIANKGNVDYYNALSQLAGKDNSALNTTGMLVDPATGQLTSAAAFRQGDGSIRNLLDTNQQSFRNAMGNSIQGTGGASSTNQSPAPFTPAAIGLGGGSTGHTSTTTVNIGDYLRNAGINYGALTGGVNNSGDPTGLSNSDVKANEALRAGLNNYLNQSGYNNYLTTGGVQSAQTAGSPSTVQNNTGGVVAADSDLFGYKSGNNPGYYQGYAAPTNNFAGETRSAPMTAEEVLQQFAQNNSGK